MAKDKRAMGASGARESGAFALGATAFHALLGLLLLLLYAAAAPVFTRVFEDLDAELPPVSVRVILISEQTVKHWPLVVCGGIGLLIGQFFLLLSLPTRVGRPIWTTITVLLLVLLVLSALALVLPMVGMMKQLQ